MQVEVISGLSGAEPPCKWNHLVEILTPNIGYQHDIQVRRRRLGLRDEADE